MRDHTACGVEVKFRKTSMLSRTAASYASVRSASLTTNSPEMIVAWALPARSLVAIQNQGRDNADEKHHKKKKGKDSGHLGRTRNQAAELGEHGEAADYYKPCGVVKHQ